MKIHAIKYALHIASFYIAVSLPLCGVQAEENTLQLRETIQGNQEQPTVLYIVPWRSVEAPPASYRPLANLVKENYQLVDRDEFRRALEAAKPVSKRTAPQP